MSERSTETFVEASRLAHEARRQAERERDEAVTGAEVIATERDAAVAALQVASKALEAANAHIRTLRAEADRVREADTRASRAYRGTELIWEAIGALQRRTDFLT